MQFVKEKSACIDQETKYIIDHICQWEKQNPGEEMVFITLPKYDRDERKRVLDLMVKFLSEENFSSPYTEEAFYFSKPSP